jgi:hypothetical protein
MQGQSSLAHDFGVGAAGDERDVAAGPAQSYADRAAHRAGADDHIPHAAILPCDVSAAG